MHIVEVPVREEIWEAIQRRRATRPDVDWVSFVAELIDLGFEYRLRQLYARFEQGEISLGYLAQELGLSLRDAYHLLEERGWPTSNIGAAVAN